MLGSPFAGGGVGVAGRDEVGAGRLFEEVYGVAGAHAAEAGDGDLEFANHCVRKGDIRGWWEAREERGEFEEERSKG